MSTFQYYSNENSIFREQVLFFKTFLKANRISFIKCTVYVKRYENNYKKLPNDILNTLIHTTNKIISIFIDENLYETYEKELLNYKIECIKFRYYFLKKEFK